MPIRGLLRDNRAVAAIEFAIGGSVLIFFMFAIINIGDLALTLSALEHGVQQASRYASVTTSNAIGAGTLPGCTATSAVQSAFAAAVQPPIPTAGIPNVSVAWGGSLAATCGVLPGASVDKTTGPSGGWVTVNVAYTWVPIGLPNVFGQGFPLNATDTAAVIGTGP